MRSSALRKMLHLQVLQSKQEILSNITPRMFQRFVWSLGSPENCHKYFQSVCFNLFLKWLIIEPLLRSG